MNNLMRIISIIISFTVTATFGLHNSSSISWITTGLEKFEASIPVPHYHDTFDILVEEDTHSLTFLTWKNENILLSKLFKLTVKTQSSEGEIYTKVCNIDPPPVNESDWIIPKSVSFLKRDCVLLCWQRGSKIHDTEESQTKFQVIFTNTCQSSEYSTMKTPKDSVSGPGIITVIFKNTYDVIFHQSTIAPVNYFKWSFDYNGTALKSTPEQLVKLFPEISKFSHITSIFPLRHSRGEGYVFVGRGIDNQNIYSSLSGWLTAERIYFSDHAFSNSNGFATICWKLKLKPGSNQIRCKCLDETCIRNDTPDYILIVKNQVFQHFEEFSIYNQPDGRMLLLSEIFNISNSKALLIVDEVQSDEKCRRLEVIELPGNLDKVELSINDLNRYCFSYVTHVFTFDQSHPRLNQFTTKCIQMMPDKILQDRRRRRRRRSVVCGAI